MLCHVWRRLPWRPGQGGAGFAHSGGLGGTPADRFGGNQMRGLRCALDQAMNVVLQHTVRIRHPFVLAQMFEPRLDQEGFEEATAVGGVFEDSPRVRAIPPPFMAEPLERGEERCAVVGTDAVFDRYHYRTLIVFDVPDDERRRPGHRGREV